MNPPRGDVMKFLLVAIAIVLISACSKHQTTQETPNHPPPNSMSQEQRDAECMRLQRELSRQTMSVDDAAIKGDTGALVGRNLDKGRIERLKARAAELGCPDVSPPPGEAQGGRLSFDECFNKCKELTNRTDEQCFDACR